VSERTQAEEPIEVHRYVNALRRGVPLILAVAVALALSTYFVSSLLPKRYKAQASIVKQDTAVVTQGQSNDSISRQLTTVQRLLTTNGVLAAAARRVPGENVTTLTDKVTAAVDPEANLVYVTAKDGSPTHAADIANAVATTFASEQAAIQRRQVEAARTALQQELTRLRAQPGSAAQVQALQQRLSDLNLSIASAGTDLAIAQRATRPTAQDTPRPVRNTVLGLVLGLFLGVLVALGRDQLVPRISGSRELSRLLELPMLVSVPHVGQRRGRRNRALSSVEHQTYQTLATLVRFSLTPADGPHVVLVTSAVHGEGKSTVTARLGTALAHAGHRTLVVSADLRSPTLHELLSVPARPGLSDLLANVGRWQPVDAPALVADHIERAPGERRGVLDVLPSGTKQEGTSELLADSGLEVIFDAIIELDYTYVLLDAPPLLGIADTRVLASQCTGALFVARLERLAFENVVDAREVLDRIDRPLVGLVVVGAREGASPYYPDSGVPALADV
jgi:tyrosine-protein kinase